jgi:hypothetical protein
MVLIYIGLRHFALCCLQTNILFHWLREPVHSVPDMAQNSNTHLFMNNTMVQLHV